MNKNNTAQLTRVLLQNSAVDLHKSILQEYTLDELFTLAHQTTNTRLAFRSAWTLEHIFLNQANLLAKNKAEVIKLYISNDNESSLRSTSKLIMRLLQSDIAQITSQEKENILDKTFRLIEKNDCPIALLVNCWDILLLLSPEHTWISQELKTHITFHLERQPTPASKSRGYRILKKLERITDP